MKITVAQVRSLLDQISNEEISFSKMVEILNETKSSAPTTAKKIKFTQAARNSTSNELIELNENQEPK